MKQRNKRENKCKTGDNTQKINVQRTNEGKLDKQEIKHGNNGTRSRQGVNYYIVVERVTGVCNKAIRRLRS